MPPWGEARARERERRRQEKEERREALKGELTAEELAEWDEKHLEFVRLRVERKMREREEARLRLRAAPPLVIDLGYDPLMTPTERRSLRQQIFRCYGLSMAAPDPYRLCVTGVGPELRAELERCDGVEKWHADFVAASLEEVLGAGEEGEAGEGEEGECVEGVGGGAVGGAGGNSAEATAETAAETPPQAAPAPLPSPSPSPFRDSATLEQLGMAPRSRLVYLSADAEAELTELDTRAVYVIGGLVDRNRHKGVSHSRARDLGLPAAQLPIRRCVRLLASQALSVDQIFSLLLRMRGGEALAAAAASVVPRRKQAPGPAGEGGPGGAPPG